MRTSPMTQTITDDELWAAIDDQRTRTTALLASLDKAQWNEPSLCAGWTVRDVAAHLTLQQQTVGSILKFSLRHPSALSPSLNHTIKQSARVLAAELPTDELIRRIQAMVGSRVYNTFVTPLETLTDALVHSQDIAIPLGLPLEMDRQAAVAAATRRWDTRRTWLGWVNRRLPLDGLRLTATDVEWSAGDGPEVAGPIAALLLLVTGRPARLAELTGEGADRLRQVI